MRHETPTGNTVAAGAQSVAVRGHNLGIVNTGNNPQFFFGTYELLADAYLQPWAVFRNLDLDRFAGREWLIAEIDAFIRTNDRGYFVLESDAGVGKTTFLAHLATERSYAHHFVQVPGGDQSQAALRSLSSQLIRAWDLTSEAPGGTLATNVGRPDVFDALLQKVADRRDKESPGQPVVVVVDGLDEARSVDGGNPLGLPASLPGGVYLVVSQRNVHTGLSVRQPMTVFPLKAQAEPNLEDMRTYLSKAVNEEKLAQSLHLAAVDPESFISGVLRKCAGVWIYLHYVMAEIRQGYRRPDDVDSLPPDLWQYYANYWRRWRENEGAWEDTYLPLLCTLAAAGEALNYELLCTFAAAVPREGRRLLDEKWRPFLQTIVGDAKNRQRYGLYHSSLRQFLQGQLSGLTLRGLQEADQSFARELPAAVDLARGRITERCFQAWGGLEAGLPNLLDGSAEDGITAYAIRHLPGHLEERRDDSALHQLLCLEWPAVADLPARNAWYSVHERWNLTEAFLADLDLGTRRARAIADTAVEQDMHATDISLEVRYLLMRAFVMRQLHRASAETLLSLARSGHHSEAMFIARSIEPAEQRVDLLLKLATVVPQDEQAEARRLALIAARLVFERNESRGLRLLLDVARHAPDADRLQIINEILRRKRTPNLDFAFSEVVVLLDDLPRRRALLRRALKDEFLPWLRAQLMAALLTCTAGTRRAKVTADLLSLLSAGLSAPRWAHVLNMAAPYLTQDQMDIAIRSCLRESVRYGAPDQSTWARCAILLMDLEPAIQARTLRLASELATPTFAELFRSMADIHTGALLPESLKSINKSLNSAFPGDTRQSALAGIFDGIIQKIATGRTRAQTNEEAPGEIPETAESAHFLARLAAQLPSTKALPIVAGAFRAILSDPRPSHRAGILWLDAQIFLVDQGAAQTLVDSLLLAIRDMMDPISRVTMLFRVAAVADTRLRRQALSSAIDEMSSIARAGLVAEIIAQLPVNLPRTLIPRVLAMADDWPRTWDVDRARALTFVTLAGGAANRVAAANLFTRALASLQAVDDPSYPPVGDLSQFFGRLPPAMLEEGLQIARSFRNADARCMALAGLHPRFKGVRRHKIVAEIRASAEQAKHGKTAVESLLMVARSSSRSARNHLLRQAVRTANTDFATSVPGLLVTIASVADKPLAIRLLDRAVKSVRNSRECRMRITGLAEIASAYEKLDTTRALAIFGDVRDISVDTSSIQKCAEASAAIVSTLPATMIPSVLAAFQRTPTWPSIRNFGGLPWSMFGSGLAWFGEVVQAIALLPANQRLESWRYFADGLRDYGRDSLLFGLAELVPLFGDLGGEEGLANIARAVDDVGRWWP